MAPTLVWRKEQGADAHNKCMKDNQQTNLREPSHLCITPHSARTRACFWIEAPPSFPSFPQLSGEY
jgi:hypothetical protein